MKKFNQYIEDSFYGTTVEDFEPTGEELYEDWNELDEEAEKGGRKVKLNKPFLTPGGPKKRAVYVATERCNDLVRVFLSLSLWADRWLPDTKRAKIAGIIDEKVTEIGLKVIPYNKDEENKNLKMSIRPFH